MKHGFPRIVNIAIVVASTIAVCACAPLLDYMHRPKEMISRGRCAKVEDCRQMLHTAQTKLNGLQRPLTVWHYDDRVLYRTVLGNQKEAMEDFENVIELNYQNFTGPFTRARHEFGTEHWNLSQMYAEAWILYSSKANKLAADKFRELIEAGFSAPGAYLGYGLSLCNGEDCSKGLPASIKGFAWPHAPFDCALPEH